MPAARRAPVLRLDLPQVHRAEPVGLHVARQSAHGVSDGIENRHPVRAVFEDLSALPGSDASRNQGSVVERKAGVEYRFRV